LEFYIWIILFELLEAELDGCCIFIKLRAARRESVRVVQDRQIVVLRVVELMCGPSAV